MPEVIVYMKPTCPYSRQAMSLLQEKGCAFQKFNVANDEQRHAEMKERSGRHTVPQIFIAGRHVGGCDDLYALEARGELDALLGGAQASTAP